MLYTHHHYLAGKAKRKKNLISQITLHDSIAVSCLPSLPLYFITNLKEKGHLSAVLLAHRISSHRVITKQVSMMSCCCHSLQLKIAPSSDSNLGASGRYKPPVHPSIFSFHHPILSLPLPTLSPTQLATVLAIHLCCPCSPHAMSALLSNWRATTKKTHPNNHDSDS